MYSDTSHFDVLFRSMKVMNVPGLKKEDVESWQNALFRLEELIIFRGPELSREAVDLMLESLPNLRVLGNLSSYDIRPNDIKRFQSRVKEEEWDLQIIESDTSMGPGMAVNHNADEKEFTKYLSLHWFYLTESPGNASPSY